jgi:hypothetical protein
LTAAAERPTGVMCDHLPDIDTPVTNEGPFTPADDGAPLTSNDMPVSV